MTSPTYYCAHTGTYRNLPQEKADEFRGALLALRPPQGGDPRERRIYEIKRDTFLNLKKYYDELALTVNRSLSPRLID